MARNQYIVEESMLSSGLMVGGFLVDQRNDQIVGMTSRGVDRYFVSGEANPLTGGMGFTGTIVDMDETPTDVNTAAYPVGTLFISPEA